MEAYPIKKKYDCHLGLDKFVKEYGAPDKITYDGAQEQIGRKTESQRVMRKYKIKGNVASDTLPAKGIWVSTLLLGIDLPKLV